tara:strand:- start:3539 stop:3757 length:219 start_codon:yes stop_codon:yes gene_type:complete
MFAINAQDRRQTNLTFFDEFDDAPVQRRLACIFCHIFVSLYTVSHAREKIKQKTSNLCCVRRFSMSKKLGIL